MSPYAYLPILHLRAPPLRAQALLFIGDLNSIAALCTNFFLIVYFAINFACLGLKLAGVPNFRPRFKYFTWWTALLGAIASLGIALYLNWIMTSISIALLGAVAVYIYFFTPAKPWGDVSQALIFHQVRKYLLRLDASGSTHTKLWRPSILFSSQGELILCTVTLCANRANDLTRPPSYIIIKHLPRPKRRNRNLRSSTFATT